MAFLLVFTGSISGESLLFLSFRHFFHDRIVQFRKEHEENYGTMVQVINQHKRWMVFLIRLSAIPVLPLSLLPSIPLQSVGVDGRATFPRRCSLQLMRLSIANGYT